MQLSDLDLSKTYTYADYLKWTFDERLELIRGQIFKMGAAPRLIHQRLTLLFGRRLGNYLEGKTCEAFIAPFDVRIPKKSGNDKEIYTVLQPDVCVICDESKKDTRGCIGAPDIVIEILSPGNNKKELQNKYEIYEEAGVLEYWIVYPAEQTLTVCTLVESCFQPSRPYTIGDEIKTPILPGFILSLDDLFKNAGY
jgi:Uma2 family endonuclease